VQNGSRSLSFMFGNSIVILDDYNENRKSAKAMEFDNFWKYARKGNHLLLHPPHYFHLG